MNRILLAAAGIMAGALLLYLNAHAALSPAAVPTPTEHQQLMECQQEREYYLQQRDQLEAALLRIQVQKQPQVPTKK